MKAYSFIKRIFVASVFLFVSASCLFASEVLTLEECVNIALKNHPDLEVASRKIESKEAAIIQKKSTGVPQLSGSVGYTRKGSSTTVGDTGSYGTSVTLDQSIYDWDRRKLNVENAILETEATKYDYLAAKNKVISNVRAAYYSLNSAIRRNKVAEIRYENYRKRLNWAKSFHEAGKKPKIEVTKAETDLANSKLALVRTESAIEQSRVQLATEMGDAKLKIQNVKDVLDISDSNVAVEEAVNTAFINRPDLSAKKKRVEYAETSLAIEKKGLLPSINASAGYSWAGSSPFETDGWTAKVSVNLPMLDGGLTKGKVLAATADLHSINAEKRGLENSIVLEVKKAWQSLEEAKEALSASREAEKQAQETYKLAEGRYEAGVGNSLEMSDAVESFASAQTNTILSLYDYKVSQLTLEKAMGELKNE